MSTPDIAQSEMDETLELFRSGGGVHYFMRSDEGVLSSSSPEYGAVLDLWREYQLASEFCRLHNEKYKTNYRVVQIDTRHLPAMLKDFKGRGDKYVQLGTSLETSKVIPIETMLEIAEGTIKKINALRLQTDEFVCLLESRRAVMDLKESDRFLPVDCGNCGALFTVHETLYRDWRSGQSRDMACPRCLSVFEEGRWGYVRCRSCGAFSGSMPLSLSERFKKSEDGWRCQKCARSDAELQLQKTLQQYGINKGPAGASAKPSSSGCLSLVFISLCVALLIILGL